MILSGISVHPHRLGVGENPKTLVRLQEKIMGLERRTPAATAMLITPRPFNEQSAMSPCQFGSGLKCVEHGWAPQQNKNGTDPGDIYMADRCHAYIEEAMR